MTIQFVVPVDCRPAPRVKGGNIRYYMPDWYRELKQTIGLYAQRAMRGKRPALGAVSVEVLCLRNKNPLSRSFGDIDNLFKTIADALNEICYDDDAQIVSLKMRIAQGAPPQIYIKVKTCADDNISDKLLDNAHQII